MPKTKDEITSQRLQKTYGITLEQYNRMFEEQGGVCAICQHPPKTVRLSVDHDHKPKYFTICIDTLNHGLMGTVEFVARFTNNYAGLWSFPFLKKRTAIRDLRDKAKQRSIRGLLCPSCNRALRMLRDNVQSALRAAAYLTAYEQRTKGSVQ